MWGWDVVYSVVHPLCWSGTVNRLSLCVMMTELLRNDRNDYTRLHCVS